MKVKVLFWVVLAYNFCLLYLPGLAQSQKRVSDVRKIEIGCLRIAPLAKHYIFNSTREYQNALDKYISPHPSCPDLNELDIDFTTQTLVGLKTNLGGCRAPEFRTEFYKKDNAIVYKQYYKQNGGCRALYQKFHWWAIPKTTKENIKFELLQYEKH